MRVIAGQYRGRVLKSPPNSKTRPTSDRLRESLFNILAPRIASETRFLDLCAGTGAVGIEAVSRGAQHAAFVDISRKACGLIEENLDLLEIPEEETVVVCSDAEEFLKKAQARREGWDIIFYDPPYNADYIWVLDKIGEDDSRILLAEGVLIAEHSKNVELPDRVGELRRWRLLKQGDSCLSFYERE